MTTVQARLVVGNVTHIESFQAARPIEKATTLPLRNYSWSVGVDPPADPSVQGAVWKTPVFVRLADVLIPECKAGDRLTVRFCFEASNKVYRTVSVMELSWNVFLTQSRTAIEGIRFPGGAMSVNVDAIRHHEDAHYTGAIAVPYDGDWYVAATVYGGGSSYSLPGDHFKVEVGYGSLEVDRARNA